MSEFIEVARLDQVAPGASLVVEVSGVSVALFNVDGAVYALDRFSACMPAPLSPSEGSRAGSSPAAPTA